MPPDWLVSQDPLESYPALYLDVENTLNAQIPLD